MTDSEGRAKAHRLLTMCAWFKDGRIVKKPEAAKAFQVAERSIQRDFDELRCFFAEQDPPGELVYDARGHGYRLISSEGCFFSNSEALAVCKILLESRSMKRDEMFPILDKLVDTCVPTENKAAVAALISNEKFHYIEPHHGRDVLPGLWELGRAVQEHRVVEIEYERLKEPKLVKRAVEPVGIMFSEYYFYLTAILRDVDREREFENKDDLFPTIYRIDRIKDFTVLEERFQVPYSSRFEEGEFRKRVQFMYGGKLEQVKFKYTGPSLEAVLDRLPTATAKEVPGGWEVNAEVFGKGIEMWLRSQGTYVERIGGGSDER